jgi:hypothetical protein
LTASWLTPRRLLGALVLAAMALHCSLSVSPSDYTRGLKVNDAGRSEQDAEEVDAGDGAMGHIVVVAGLRDGLNAIEASTVKTSDVWTASIDGAGVIGPWSIGPPAPFRGNARTGIVAGSSLFVVAEEGADGSPVHTAVEWISLQNGSPGPRWEVLLAEVPGADQFSMLLLPTGLVALGGLTPSSKPDAGPALERTDDVQVSPFDPVARAFSPRRALAHLATPRTQVISFAYKNFIYAIGGYADGGISDAVDVLAIPDLKGLPTGNTSSSKFTATSKLVNPANGAAYRVVNAAVCAGEGSIYVIGGSLASGLSDIVLMNRIDEATGQLGPWVSMPKLPGPLDAPSCVVRAAQAGGGSYLYVLGGRGATGHSKTILAARIGAGGVLGEWDTRTQTPLPSPRSFLTTVVY